MFCIGALDLQPAQQASLTKVMPDAMASRACSTGHLKHTAYSYSMLSKADISTMRQQSHVMVMHAQRARLLEYTAICFAT